MKKINKLSNLFTQKNTSYFIIIFIIFFILLMYLISGYTSKRYYNIYPTIYLYPNNIKEIEIVRKCNNERLKNNTINDFVKLTDKSVSYAFIQEFSDLSLKLDELDSISYNINYIIIFLKNLFNRARPNQIDKSLNSFESKTASTPSFPSGHSAQALYIAKKLSEKYPDKKDKFYDLAEKCGMARIYGGLHYPSDHEFSRKIVKLIP
jgi:hypothetical protein